MEPERVIVPLPLPLPPPGACVECGFFGCICDVNYLDRTPSTFWDQVFLDDDELSGQ